MYKTLVHLVHSSSLFSADFLNHANSSILAELRAISTEGHICQGLGIFANIILVKSTLPELSFRANHF